PQPMANAHSAVTFRDCVPAFGLIVSLQVEVVEVIENHQDYECARPTKIPRRGNVVLVMPGSWQTVFGVVVLINIGVAVHHVENAFPRLPALLLIPVSEKDIGHEVSQVKPNRTSPIKTG